MAALVGISCLSSGANADVLGSSELPPFSEAERAVIARNPLLKGLVDSDPRAVRRALDQLRALGPEGAADGIKGGLSPEEEFSPQEEGRQEAIRGEGDATTLDTESSDVLEPEYEDNPDLRRLQRSSPEAAHDLLQMLKKAGSGQGGKAQ